MPADFAVGPDQKKHIVQVVLSTKDGWPVKREWDAIMDLFDHADSVEFVPYN